MSKELHSEANGSIHIEPLSVHIGAQIHGVDLRSPLSEKQVVAIRDALLRWKVIFFRNQSLDHKAHVRFARYFGEATPAHVIFGTNESYPEVYSVSKHRVANSDHGEKIQKSWTGWHTDITAAINPPFASILRGDIVPPYGGDTQWTNLALAYDQLSTAMKTFVESLNVVHAYGAGGVARSTEYHERINGSALVAEHPLVTVHPETGEKILNVSPDFVSHVVELKPVESIGLLDFLKEHAVRPEFTVRFKWTPGSIAFWDNRATSHLAPVDIFSTEFDRQFYRVTLVGEIPKGRDGRVSKLISGQPIGPCLKN